MRSRVVQESGWLLGDSGHLGFSGIRAGGRHLELSRVGEAGVFSMEVSEELRNMLLQVPSLTSPSLTPPPPSIPHSCPMCPRGNSVGQASSSPKMNYIMVSIEFKLPIDIHKPERLIVKFDSQLPGNAQRTQQNWLALLHGNH